MITTKRLLVHVMVIFMALSFTSCINIVEKVFFKKNGGGTYSMTLDMSSISNMMAAMGEENNEMTEAFDEMDDEFQQSKAKLESVSGVTNVRQKFDRKSFILTLEFDFEDIDALNRGMSEYYHNESEGPTVKQHTFFTQNKKTITRTATDVIGESLKRELESDEDEDIDMSVILADMYHETVMEFERDIKSFSNDNYTMDGKRMVRWKKYLFNKRDQEKSHEVSVSTR